MEQSSPEVESNKDQEMQVDEIHEIVHEQTDQTQNIDKKVDAVEGNVEAIVRKESTVHASTSKVNSIVTKELIRGRQILLRKCKTKSKDLLAKLAKGFVPITFEIVPKVGRRKRNRRLFISEKRAVRSERNLQRKYNRSRYGRCEHSCLSRRKY